MQHYESKDNRFVRNIRKGAPDAFAAYSEFSQQAFAEEGRELSVKTRELMAVAVSATTQCPHCIEKHSRAAAKAGASEAELAEAVMVASAVRAGGAVTHGWMAMKFFQDEAATD